MEYHYTKVDLNEWNRGRLFKTYIDNMRIVMSLTVDVDVTNLIQFCEKKQLKILSLYAMDCIKSR